ncbi:MAG TPA: DUF1902 domain-containing protein [Methylocystis sp.]|nr:DUF1902 domain-containing protein [Methylocystis sp.]
MTLEQDTGRNATRLAALGESWRPISGRVDLQALTSDADPQILNFMAKELHIVARWDDEARVWIATSLDAPGFAAEAESWAAKVDEVRLVLPDLMEIDDEAAREISLTFKAETHLGLATR